MKIHAFVFCWPGYAQKAAYLEKLLASNCHVTVVNCDETQVNEHPDWCHLDGSAHFTEQWNKAISMLEGDILFHIQSDASLNQIPATLQACAHLISHHNVGVWAPNVNYTPHQFSRQKLKKLISDVYEVPQTDCTCWALHSSVVERAPKFDPLTCKFGWGIDWLTIATSRIMNLKVVRDYRFTVQHPRRTSYNRSVAEMEWLSIKEKLPQQLHDELKVLEAEYLYAYKHDRFGIWDRIKAASHRLLRAMNHHR